MAILSIRLLIIKLSTLLLLLCILITKRFAFGGSCSFRIILGDVLVETGLGQRDQTFVNGLHVSSLNLGGRHGAAAGSWRNGKRVCLRSRRFQVRPLASST